VRFAFGARAKAMSFLSNNHTEKRLRHWGLSRFLCFFRPARGGLSYRILPPQTSINLPSGGIAGNAPRRCHNYGRFFLLSKGYNTCHCNNVAPGDTDKTCRRVGAHKKVKEKSQTDPAVFEYRKVYNRLKARKHRGKISTDEWNVAVALALKYMEKAQAGR